MELKNLKFLAKKSKLLVFLKLHNSSIVMSFSIFVKSVFV